VVNGTYRDLFIAIAGSAGALTGLLFVALSVAPHPVRASRRHVIQQVRAAAALLAFNNALAVSLFGLVPNTNIGYPAAALGVIGILFAAAAARSVIAAAPRSRRQWLSQISLLNLLVVIFGTELICAIYVLVSPRSTESVKLIGYALVTSLIVGIARAWELVGDRDTGLSASIAVLTGHERSFAPEDDPDPANDEADPTEDEAEAEPTPAEPESPPPPSPPRS
jgi:hypothetical protein